MIIQFHFFIFFSLLIGQAKLHLEKARKDDGIYPPFRPRCKFDSDCNKWCWVKRNLSSRIPDCYVHRCYCVEPRNPKPIKISGHFHLLKVIDISETETSNEQSDEKEETILKIDLENDKEIVSSE